MDLFSLFPIKFWNFNFLKLYQFSRKKFKNSEFSKIGPKAQRYLHVPKFLNCENHYEKRSQRP
eukprot:UN14363